MDAIAARAFDAATREALFAHLGLAEETLIDLGGFESFVFHRTDTDTIVRVTHTSHRDLGQVLAELHWLEYLASCRAAVCRPVPQSTGALAVLWRDFVVCEFPRASGRLITVDDWAPDLFREWGRCLGEFHRLTRDYVPPVNLPLRLDCSVDFNFDLPALMPEAQPAVMTQAEKYKDIFLGQPRASDDFGLIHCDAHAGNFHIDAGRLTFFDFDDACYSWYAYDVATVLFSAVLQRWIGDTQSERQAAARTFLPAFLEGYASERDVSSRLIEQLPLGLKFREICLYGVITRFVPPSHRDWYPKKFMAGRRQRIENDEPYLTLDFF